MPISFGRPQSQPQPGDERKVVVAGNWKMNKTYSAAVQLAQLVDDRLERSWKNSVEIVLCPPATALRGVSNVLAFDKSFAKVGGQDCSPEDAGAFTGDISAPMLADLDCAWCIVGHSERRHGHGETSEQVSAKAAALIRAGIAPIVCVGEPLDVYEAGSTSAYVTEQVRASLAGLDLAGRDFAVAYEPVWAIGSGKVPTPEYVQDVAAQIRAAVAEVAGQDCAKRCYVLYGGSVKAGNAAFFTACADVDGVLVGGDALDADKFIDIVKAVLHV